jgi:hypothetical protein
MLMSFRRFTVIENRQPPLNVPCRVFKAPTVEAAITEAAAKGYETDFVYWWNGYLYVPVTDRLASPVNGDEEDY